VKIILVYGKSFFFSLQEPIPKSVKTKTLLQRKRAFSSDFLCNNKTKFTLQIQIQIAFNLPLSFSTHLSHLYQNSRHSLLLLLLTISSPLSILVLFIVE
jgi:hypothetical protein